MSVTEQKPPFPPFTEETAKQKIQAAEDGWNSKNPEKVSMAYTRGYRMAKSINICEWERSCARIFKR